jgi:hypothetical protein
VAISGNIDVYLIPQVGLWKAGRDQNPIVTAEVPEKKVMFAYQVAPRRMYPDFVDPFNEENFYTKAEAFFEYQQNRVGMVKRHWEAVDVLGNITDITETSFTDFDGYDVFASNMSSASSNFHGSYIETVAFDRIDPLLVAVMKIRGQFYYIWDMADFADFELIAGGGYTIATEDY